MRVDTVDEGALSDLTSVGRKSVMSPGRSCTPLRMDSRRVKCGYG